MRSYSILFITALLFPTVLWAAEIDGPANVRQLPKGKKLVSLNDGIHISCQEVKNDWYRIELPVFVATDHVTNGKINKGVTLKTMAGHELGLTLETVSLELAAKYRDGISGKIIAYTHKQNIKNVDKTNVCK